MKNSLETTEAKNKRGKIRICLTDTSMNMGITTKINTKI